MPEEDISRDPTINRLGDPGLPPEFQARWAAPPGLDTDGYVQFAQESLKMTATHGSIQLYPFVGDKDQELRVLDFGCGLGRNLVGMLLYSNKWRLFGYDSLPMIFHGMAFQEKRLGFNLLDCPRVEFSSEWDKVALQKFDCIYCEVVLQHLERGMLIERLKEFRFMTPRILIFGRSCLDFDPGFEWIWDIVESILGEPVIRNDQGQSLQRNPHAHFMCLYEI